MKLDQNQEPLKSQFETSISEFLVWWYGDIPTLIWNRMKLIYLSLYDFFVVPYLVEYLTAPARFLPPIISHIIGIIIKTIMIICFFLSVTISELLLITIMVIELTLPLILISMVIINPFLPA